MCIFVVEDIYCYVLLRLFSSHCVHLSLNILEGKVMYFLVCFVIILLRNLESLKSFLFNALTVFNALSIFLKLINFFGCIRS